MTAVGCGTVELNPPQHSIKQREKCGLVPQARLRPPGKPFISLPTVCAAMGALVLALVIWRGDVVRLVPQAAVTLRPKHGMKMTARKRFVVGG